MSKSSHGPSALKKVWDFFFKPKRSAYYANIDKAHKKPHQAKRKAAPKPQAHKAPAAKRGKTQPQEASVLTPDMPAYWGYVDSKGHVRLKSNQRLLGKSARARKAALEDFAKLFQDQQQRLDTLAQHQDAPTGEHWRQLDSLKQDVRQRPGLGDLEGLEARLVAVEAAFRLSAAKVLDQRRDLTQQAQQLAKDAKLRDVSADIQALEDQWEQLPLSQAPDEAPLVLKFQHACKAARNVLRSLDEDQDAYRKEAQRLLQQLDRHKQRGEWQNALELLDSSQERRLLIDRALSDADISAQFTAIGTQAKAALAQAEADQESARQAYANQSSALLTALETLLAQANTNASWQADEGRFQALQRDWKQLQAGASQQAQDPKQDLAFAQASAAFLDGLKAQRQQASQEHAEAETRRVDLLAQFASLLQQAKAHDCDWRELDGRVQGLRKAWQDTIDQPGSGKAASQEQRRALSKHLDDLQDLRQAHWERQDQSREDALERKRVLLADLTKFPAGASAKDLRLHLEASMEAWKAAGSAGRAHEPQLWADYKAQRQIVRDAIDNMRRTEANEAAQRLSQAFQDKKQRQTRLEHMIMADQVLHDSKPSPSLLENIRKNQSQVRALQDQMMDIQKRLRRLSQIQTDSINSEAYDSDQEDESNDDQASPGSSGD